MTVECRISRKGDMQTGNEEGNHNEGTENKYSICYLEMLKKGKMCSYANKFLQSVNT